MTLIIIMVLALYSFQTILPSIFMSRALGSIAMKYAGGPRDTPLDLTVNAGRAKRALDNMVEAILVFLPLALLAVHFDLNDGLAYWGALAFLIARIAYIPAYITAIGLTRSIVWTVGHIGLGMLGWAVIQAAY